MKFWRFAGLIALSTVFAGLIFLFEINEWPAGSSIAGIVLGFSLPGLWHSIQDLLDTTNWKASQRKLKRGGFITGGTIVRISFAYLYRIKVGNKYFLVKNERGTGKYQPVGGVYKLKGNEKIELKNRYHVMDDNKVLIDESSRDDYRLRIENKYLRKFVRRFNGKAERERVENLSREFKEELIKKGIVSWSQIKYRFSGRHMTDLKFGDHFQIYEFLLADVVELLPTVEQEKDLQLLMAQHSDAYRFASGEEITSLGINTETGALEESISDHTKKIIQENEGQLMKISNTGKTYTVKL
ncbi:MAG: hypothetical protein ACOYJB_08475 [Christensenellaceae bacterium]|jgi:hypothetical protein